VAVADADPGRPGGGSVGRPGRVAPAAGWPDLPPVDAHAPRRLLIEVLGPVRVLLPHPDGSRSTVTISRTASVQLLVLLCAYRRGVSTAQLRAALWPGVPPGSANRRLATSLWALRSALTEAAGGEVVHRRMHPARDGGIHYQLAPDRVQVDLWQLHDLLDTADITGEVTDRRRLLRDAADLARGELAEGMTGAWLYPHRERTVRHLLDIYSHLADVEPEPLAALGLLRRALHLAPHTEAIARAAMTRAAALGDHDALRRAMATLTERLSELHATPDATTRQLYRTLTEQLDPPTPAAAAAAPEPRPAGTEPP
jgi:DNA-binding SARP family transcriptional activator